MLSKLVRASLFLWIAVSLLACSGLPADTPIQASPAQADLQVNAPAFVTGPIFNQPVSPNGKLLLSSWLDPDGSDSDQYIWDNFTLQSNGTITEIDWFGGYDPLRFGAGGPVLDFTVAIYPPDTFYIYMPALNGYESGGALTGGNITIHK